MRITPRTLTAGVVTGLLALGLVSQPAEAYTRKEKRAEKRQNTAIKRTSRSTKKLRTASAKAEKQIADLAGGLGRVAGQSKANADTIAAVVPSVAGALTSLREGLTAAGTGITQLKTGLETLAAGTASLKTALETLAGSTAKLGSAYEAVEYGATRIYATDLTTEETGAIGASSANSGDIPDDSNGAVVSAALPITAAKPTRFTLRAAIRSNESDGTGADNPAGQVGGVLYATCLANCSNGEGGELTAGQLACDPAGPPPLKDFGEPFGEQPLVDIPTKSPRAGFEAPTADAPEATEAGGCTVGGPANPGGPAIYEVKFSAQFFDFPRSTTPGPTD